MNNRKILVHRSPSQEEYDRDCYYHDGWNSANRLIVRCKDCMHVKPVRISVLKGYSKCGWWLGFSNASVLVEDDDFCSHGELEPTVDTTPRKDEGGKK